MWTLLPRVETIVITITITIRLRTCTAQVANTYYFCQNAAPSLPLPLKQQPCRPLK